jgi:threonine/homoserine/homoserine lactone efflux protein
VIGRALTQGRRAALTTVAENTIGAYVLVAAVACGVGSVVQRSAVIFESLKLAGAAYLLYLEIKAVRGRRALREWGLAAAGGRDWFALSPERLAAIGGVGGLSMNGLGVTLAVTGRKD